MLPEDLQDFQSAFSDFVMADIEKSLSGDLEVGTIILVVIGIECLSGYYAGKASNRQTFVSFVNGFLPQYASHAENIYACIRDGLAHDYIIKEVYGKSFRFTRDKGEAHLKAVEGKPEWFYINREAFARDFLLAQSVYFKKLRNNVDLQEKARKRLKRRSFLAVFSPKKGVFIQDDSSDSDLTMVTGTYPSSDPKF